ncbi:hypothetical protein HD842_002540 [Massilia aurea]|uniref:Uncharacterized protein n=1 Tax=Massilia aurea TaxID=373040 RepID=A0A7X0CEU3_9BURK|nr:ATP-binding protein [Massilia aurea]MBB6134398.1 hypothetical protein [Massilia aurea]
MLNKIQILLSTCPELKAKNIAEKLSLDRSAVSKILHDNKDIFVQDLGYQWSLISDSELKVEFMECSWMSADIFEESLLNKNVLDGNHSAVTFVIAKDCNILLEALARILAICNQLRALKKKVTIDFSNCKKSIGYFSRIGLFDQLEKDIEIKPYRPMKSRATTYAGNNNSVVELRSIDPISPDRKIPKNLKESFEVCAGKSYSQVAFTVLSELFGNVYEHSGSTRPGFAALQAYAGKKPHIQTVISDSGVGIVGTLMPILEKKYPELLRKINSSKLDPRVALLTEVFLKGGFSKSDDDGRGLGLKRSAGIAKQFSAKISVRQETFELRMNYVNGQIKFSHSLGLTKILGTHICFDFLLDDMPKSG